MNRVLLLLLGLLCSYATAERRQVTITIGDNILEDQKPKGFVSELGSMLRNMFSFTNTLRSDMRRETGFKAKELHHHTVHTECNKPDCGCNKPLCDCNHSEEKQAPKGEPILENVFNRLRAVPLSKLKKKPVPPPKPTPPPCNCDPPQKPPMPPSKVLLHIRPLVPKPLPKPEPPCDCKPPPKPLPKPEPPPCSCKPPPKPLPKPEPPCNCKPAPKPDPPCKCNPPPKPPCKCSPPPKPKMRVQLPIYRHIFKLSPPCDPSPKTAPPCNPKTRPCKKPLPPCPPKPPLDLVKERVRMSFPYRFINGRRRLVRPGQSLQLIW